MKITIDINENSEEWANPIDVISGISDEIADAIRWNNAIANHEPIQERYPIRIWGVDDGGNAYAIAEVQLIDRNAIAKVILEKLQEVYAVPGDEFLDESAIEIVKGAIENALETSGI